MADAAASPAPDACKPRKRSADAQQLEADFRAEIARRGGTVEGDYVGVAKPIQVQCASGHVSYPQPRSALKGHGCVACAGRETGRSESRFREAVTVLGAEVIGPYIAVGKPIVIRCANGHESRPIPKNVLNGQGVCGMCARNAPGMTEAQFRLTVADLGGEVLGPFLNVNTPILIRCRNGHQGYPRPADVQRGIGICNACHGKTWDVFYTVVDDIRDILKFGITSGDSRWRLNCHKADGFDRVVRLHEKLPEGVARELENHVRFTLRDAGEHPVRGREYFPSRVLPVVLDVVDNHPAVAR
ncbi:hypothetical protein [Streptomyces sp. NPDC096013]|uniref:hypothetical protein n=1 Tax=Streptomyces sp. NPDC096013 TaxID=3366069 RepID=UPI0038127BE3